MIKKESFIQKYYPVMVTVVFFTFGVFPLLPNKLKGLPVILLAVVAVLSLFLNDRKKVNRKNIVPPLLFTGLFLCYLCSLLYTDDMRTGSRRIETSLSFFLVPWSMYFISLTSLGFKEVFVYVEKIFTVSAALYGMVIIWFFWNLGYYDGLHNLEYCLSWLDGMLWGFSQHPIYAAMFSAIAVLFAAHVWFNLKPSEKIVAIITLTINIYILFLLIRKGVLIALAFALIIWIYKFRKSFKTGGIIAGCCLILTALIFFNASITNRFSEFFSKQSYNNLDIENSSSMRFAIYQCTWEEIKKSPVIGHGVGDGYDLIAGCLNSHYNVVFVDSKQKKNSHNQFLGILLYTGIIGLTFFITQMICYYKKAVLNKNLLFVKILVFFSILLFTENILDRQSGIILFMFLINYMYFLLDKQKINQ